MKVTVQDFNFLFQDDGYYWVARFPDIMVRIHRNTHSLTRGVSWSAVKADLDKISDGMSPAEWHCEEAYQAFLASIIVN